VEAIFLELLIDTNGGLWWSVGGHAEFRQEQRLLWNFLNLGNMNLRDIRFKRVDRTFCSAGDRFLNHPKRVLSINTDWSTPGSWQRMKSPQLPHTLRTP
jgi:hypothetical protein